jgi:hypothetical protein
MESRVWRTLPAKVQIAGRTSNVERRTLNVEGRNGSSIKLGRLEEGEAWNGGLFEVRSSTFNVQRSTFDVQPRAAAVAVRATAACSPADLLLG